jgi:hypothetical protein
MRTRTKACYVVSAAFAIAAAAPFAAKAEDSLGGSCGIFDDWNNGGTIEHADENTTPRYGGVYQGNFFGTGIHSNWEGGYASEYHPHGNAGNCN